MIDADERALLEETVNSAIAHACAKPDAATAIDAALAQLGWREMLDAEPRVAIEIVFTALGATNAAASALDDVIASALGAEPHADLAVLLPRFGTWDPPGRTDAGRLLARGLATARASSAGELLLVYGAGGELWSVTVPMAAAEISAVHGIDPDAGFRAIRVQAAVPDARRLDAASWEAAVGSGRRALAHQIAGACRTMLGLARTHALERVQFGRPIARFQAVRHRLAEALVAVEALEAALAAAAEQPGPETAALAKAVAGRTARTVAAHSQQVLAGIGFTTDHPFHRYLKRSMALEGIFGSADEIALAVGRQLLAARRVPTLIEL